MATNDIEMRAKKTFFKNGTFIRAGQTFTAPEYSAQAYETRNLAERLDAETKVSEPTETKEVEEHTTDEKTYSEMTKAKLVELAKERGIEGYSTMTKADLVQAHEAYDNNQTVEGNEA